MEKQPVTEELQSIEINEESKVVSKEIKSTQDPKPNTSEDNILELTQQLINTTLKDKKKKPRIKSTPAKINTEKLLEQVTRPQSECNAINSPLGSISASQDIIVIQRTVAKLEVALALNPAVAKLDISLALNPAVEKLEVALGL